MLVISPKWIYLNNIKLETNKSLLIDGPIIIDILDNEIIEKKYKEISRTKYTNHLLMPTFTEGFFDTNDCLNKVNIEMKMKSLLKNGVTRLCVNNKSYKDILSIDINQLDISHIIELDGRNVHQEDINKMIDLLDFYKNDPSKQFCLCLNNIIDFDKEVIIKLSSIINEIDVSLHIKGQCLQNISDKKTINKLINFWSEINLINDSYLHGFLSLNERWQPYIKKSNITIMISYEELFSIENITRFNYLINKKYKCLLITDTHNSYDLYYIIKLIQKIDIDQNDIFDKNKIINCVTENASNLFPNFISTGAIKIGNRASFNLFDITYNQLLKNMNIPPKLSSLDKQSLTHVWSAGEQYKI